MTCFSGRSYIIFNFILPSKHVIAKNNRKTLSQKFKKKGKSKGFTVNRCDNLKELSCLSPLRFILGHARLLIVFLKLVLTSIYESCIYFPLARARILIWSCSFFPCWRKILLHLLIEIFVDQFLPFVILLRDSCGSFHCSSKPEQWTWQRVILTLQINRINKTGREFGVWVVPFCLKM